MTNTHTFRDSGDFFIKQYNLTKPKNGYIIMPALVKISTKQTRQYNPIQTNEYLGNPDVN